MDYKYDSTAGMWLYDTYEGKEDITQFRFCVLLIALNLSCSMENLGTRELTHQLDTNAR